MELKAVLRVFFDNISAGDFEKLIGDKLLDKMENKHKDLFTDMGSLTSKVRKDLKQYLLENPFLAKEMRNMIRNTFEEYCEGSKYGLPRKKNGKKKKKIITRVLKVT